jgi:hypothetical protein
MLSSLADSKVTSDGYCEEAQKNNARSSQLMVIQ